MITVTLAISLVSLWFYLSFSKIKSVLKAAKDSFYAGIRDSEKRHPVKSEFNNIAFSSANKLEVQKSLAVYVFNPFKSIESGIISINEIIRK